MPLSTLNSLSPAMNLVFPDFVNTILPSFSPID